MDSNFLLDLAIVGAHAKNNGQWIRQRDVRFAAERLWTLGSVQEDVALHNTQVLRKLEGLFSSGFMNRRDGPEYQLSGLGCVHLLQICRSHGACNPDFQTFLLAYYFVSSYREHLLKLMLNDSALNREDVRAILNSRQLLEERRLYLAQLESKWQDRVEEGAGLIGGDRVKKLSQPSLEWIKHQQKILSQF